MYHLKRKNHIDFGCGRIQDGRLVAILLLKRVPNHFSDMHGLILFKRGTSTVHDGIHLHLILVCDLIKDGPTGRLLAILFVNKYGLAL